MLGVEKLRISGIRQCTQVGIILTSVTVGSLICCMYLFNYFKGVGGLSCNLTL